MPQQLQIRRGTAAQWTSANTVLMSGEQGYETDTGKMKIGDGSTAWTSLAYFSTGSSSGGSASNATTTSPGLVQLAGDLTGTATAPTIAKLNGLAISGTPASGKYLDGSGAWTTLPAGSGGTGSGSNATDHILYVSKAGSDSNDGLSWKSAFATIAKAMQSAGAGATVYMGAGNWNEGLDSQTGSYTTYDVVFRGAGKRMTTWTLTANGTLVNMYNAQQFQFHNIGFQFASASITGTLFKFTNSFAITIQDCELKGQNAAGQVGVNDTTNSGDLRVQTSEFLQLDIGWLVASTVSVDTDCWYTNCNTGLKNGGPTASGTMGAGHQSVGSVWRGTGNYYVDLTGAAQGYSFVGCWFDGNATTGVRVGDANGGPDTVYIGQCAWLAGAVTSLSLGQYGVLTLENVVFGDSYVNNQHPTEIVYTAGVPTDTKQQRGSIHGCYSYQANAIESKVPQWWEGARGYIRAGANDAIRGTGSYEWIGTNYWPWFTKKKFTLTVMGRAAADAAVTIPWPAGKPTPSGEHVFRFESLTKTVDTTGASGITFNSDGITFPTGVAIASGLIVIEGF